MTDNVHGPKDFTWSSEFHPPNTETEDKAAKTPQSVSWSEELKEHCGKASVVGLSYVVNPSASAFRRFIWAVLLLGGLAFTIYQIQDRIRYFIRWPTNTVVTVEHPDHIRFPTITICNENRISRAAAAEHGRLEMITRMFPPAPIPGFHPNFTEYDLDQYGVDWYGEYERMTRPPKHAILICQFNGQQCDFERYFTTIPTDMGFCMSFNPAGMNHIVRQSGSTSGLQLLLHVNQEDYLYASSTSAGFRVLLHDPKEKPLMLERAFKVSPGFLTQVAILGQYGIDLPSPYSDCEPSDNYTQSNCLAECEANYIIRNCGCKDIAMPGISLCQNMKVKHTYLVTTVHGLATVRLLPPDHDFGTVCQQTSVGPTSLPKLSAGSDAPVCDPRTFYECLLVQRQNYVHNNEAAKCGCARQCRSLTYPLHASQALLSNVIVEYAKQLFHYNRTLEEIRYDNCEFQVFFSQLATTYIEAEAAYSLLALLCDIGGALGLILGSTLLTVCEFTDFFLTTSWMKMREGRSYAVNAGDAP